MFCCSTSELCGGDEWIFLNENDTNNSSVSNDFQEDLYESADNIRGVAYRIVAPIIVVVGILGNILNLTVMTKPFLKGSTRLFLISLAISDLSVMITVIPMVFRLNDYYGTSFEAAFFHAHVELLLTNIFITASVLIVLCLTIERYFSVCLPTIFRSLHTKKNARICIMWCYIIALLVSLPLTVLKRVCLMSKNSKTTCEHWEFQENVTVTNTTYWTAYLWLSEFLIRLGPCVILGVLNILIIKKFRQVTEKRKFLLAALSQSSTKPDAKSLKNKKYQAEKRLIVLLRAIVVLFFITMTPSSILSLIYSEMQEKTIGFQVFRAAANNLELANFAFNFYVYFLCSKEFRTALVNVFTGCYVSDDELSDAENGEMDVPTNTH